MIKPSLFQIAILSALIALPVLPGCDKADRTSREESLRQLQAKDQEIEKLNRQIGDLKSASVKEIPNNPVDPDKLTASVVDAVSKIQTGQNAEITGKIDQILEALKGGNAVAAASPAPAAGAQPDPRPQRPPATKSGGTVAAGISKAPARPQPVAKPQHDLSAPPAPKGKQTLDYAKSL